MGGRHYALAVSNPFIPTSSASLEVRRAANTDLEALLALENRVFTSDRLNSRQFRQHIQSPSACVLVAICQQRLVGDAVLFFRKKSTIARLYSIAVTPDMHGRGVGSILLDAVEKTALQHHCQSVRLEVRQDNLGAQRLYEQKGYRRFAIKPHFYEDGHAAVRYEKRLRKTPNSGVMQGCL